MKAKATAGPAGPAAKAPPAPVVGGDAASLTKSSHNEVVASATAAIEAHAAGAKQEGKLTADVIAEAAQKIDTEALEAKDRLSHPEHAKKADDAKAAAESAAKEALSKRSHEEAEKELEERRKRVAEELKNIEMQKRAVTDQKHAIEEQRKALED